MKTKTTSLLVLFAATLALQAAAATAEGREDARQRVALQVARIYELSREQAIVLLAIYEHEAGGPGREFGIEWLPCAVPRDGRRSFLDNCARCCEVIKKRCPDASTRSLRRMNRGYGGWTGYAADKDWWRGVRRGVRKYKNLRY